MATPGAMAHSAILFPDWGLTGTYRRLRHPQFADQLLPYIVEDHREVAVQIAITMAQLAEVRDPRILDALVRRCLDDRLDRRVRVDALAAVLVLGDDATKARLVPVTQADDDELKGWALEATWPGILSTEDMFAALRPTRARGARLGAIYHFVSSRVLPKLTKSDVVAALRWVAGHHPNDIDVEGLEELRQQILVSAWDFLDLPGVLELFADVVIERLEAYSSFAHGAPSEFSKVVDDDEGKRRQLLAAVLTRASDPDRLIRSFRSRYSVSPLFRCAMAPASTRC
jgi:hypothetical protein